MPCGLFGKLAAKRDFIAVNTPRDVLLGWEAWMQSSIAASKHGLGQGWLKAYMQAPLWRFWLGQRVCGLEVMGVFMSSMDGVGRQFPLTVFTCAEPGRHFIPPSDGADQSWYEEAEDFLLATLDAGEDYDLVLARLGALRDGPQEHWPAQDHDVTVRHGSMIWIGPEALAAVNVPGGLAAMPDPTDGPAIAASSNPVSGAASAAAEPPPPAGEPISHDAAITSNEEDAVASGPPAPDRAAHEASAGASAPADALAASDASVILQPGEEDAFGAATAAASEMGAPLPRHGGFGFAELEAESRRSSAGSRSFWWTIGGHDHPPMTMMAEGLPDPQLMSLMLTGNAGQPAN